MKSGFMDFSFFKVAKQKGEILTLCYYTVALNRILKFLKFFLLMDSKFQQTIDYFM